MWASPQSAAPRQSCRLTSSLEVVEKVSSMPSATVPAASQGPRGLKAMADDVEASLRAAISSVERQGMSGKKERLVSPRSDSGAPTGTHRPTGWPGNECANACLPLQTVLRLLSVFVRAELALSLLAAHRGTGVEGSQPACLYRPLSARREFLRVLCFLAAHRPRATERRAQGHAECSSSSSPWLQTCSTSSAC